MSNIATLEEIQDFKGKYPKQLWALFFSEMWGEILFLWYERDVDLFYGRSTFNE